MCKVIYEFAGASTAVIAVGYCPDTLAYFRRLYEEAQKSFPALSDIEVTCSRARNSQTMDGFTVILFKVPAGHKKLAGWQYVNDVLPFSY